MVKEIKGTKGLLKTTDVCYTCNTQKNDIPF